MEKTTRREVFRIAAGAALTAPHLSRPVALLAAGKTPVFFTDAEFRLLDQLTELIIPTDDHSPGARAAQVAGYIDRELAESFEQGPRQQWRDGLKLIETISAEMNGKPFLESTEAQQIALLKRISKNERKPVGAEEVFFEELKRKTVHAYYTSEIGIHKEIEYKGNVLLPKFAGYDAV